MISRLFFRKQNRNFLVDQKLFLFETKVNKKNITEGPNKIGLKYFYLFGEKLYLEYLFFNQTLYKSIVVFFIVQRKVLDSV